jgi:hypothetical protein
LFLKTTVLDADRVGVNCENKEGEVNKNPSTSVPSYLASKAKQIFLFNTIVVVKKLCCFFDFCPDEEGQHGVLVGLNLGLGKFLVLGSCA